MSDEDIKSKIKNDLTHVRSAKHNNNIDNVLKDHEDGLDDSKIARMLLMKEEDVKSMYNNIIEKMKKVLGKMQ